MKRHAIFKVVSSSVTIIRSVYKLVSTILDASEYLIQMEDEWLRGGISCCRKQFITEMHREVENVIRGTVLRSRGPWGLHLADDC